jgi:4'-phosphopantetheinyl transferase EntD
VALSHRLCAIGIDAEPHAELSDATLDLVLRDEERARMKSLAAARPNRHWDRVHFCAKEAVYKAWFSLTRRWLEFEDVSITFDLAGTFSARIDVSEPVAMGVDLSRLGGRWAIGSGLVVAATWVHARPAGSVEFV